MARLRDLLWIPFNLLQLLWLLYWSAFCITLALLVRLLTGSTRLSLAMARTLWAPGLLVSGPFPYDVITEGDVDWSQTYFIVSNHQSFLDIPLLFRVLPVNLHFVVKSELKKIPFLAWYITAMGMVFVDRADRESARRSIERTAEAARSGKTILLFPEGTRSKTGDVGPFKTGMMAAAIASSVPIIPVAVEGPGEAMPGGWPRVRPRRLRVSIGAPIDTSGYGESDRRQLAGRVRREVIRLHAGLRSS